MEHTHTLMVWQGWLRLCFSKGPCLYLAASPAAWPPGRPGWRWPSGRQWSGLGLCRRGRRPSGLPLSPERGEGTQRVRPLWMDRLKNGSVTCGGVSGFSRSFYRLSSERWPRSQFTYQKELYIICWQCVTINFEELTGASLAIAAMSAHPKLLLIQVKTRWQNCIATNVKAKKRWTRV